MTRDSQNIDLRSDTVTLPSLDMLNSIASTKLGDDVFGEDPTVNSLQKKAAEMMGKEDGLCAGRGGSQHICDDGFFSNGVQGGIMPLAAGLSFAEKYKETENIVVVFIGDGTLGEGVVYETLNLCSLLSIPLLIVCENNGYAQSTKQENFLALTIIFFTTNIL